MLCATHNVVPVGSAVLTFIGYKQTNKQTDKQSINIDKYINVIKMINNCLENTYQ